MFDGRGSFFGWVRGSVAASNWAAWKGTNSGFDQSLNSATDNDVPLRISERTGGLGNATGLALAANAAVTFTKTIIFPLVAAPVFVEAAAPETITVDKWARPFSEPYIAKVSRAALTVLSVASGVVQPPQPVNVDHWQRPLSQPSVLRRVLPVAQYPFQVTDPTILAHPGAAAPDRWHRPFDLPVVLRKVLPVAHIPAFVIDPFVLTQPEAVSADKWQRAFSEPVRRPRPWASLYASSSGDPAPVAAASETVTVDKWARPFAEPVRKPGPWAGLYASGSRDPAAPVFVEQWQRPFSEPVRFKRGLQTAHSAFTAAPPLSSVQPVLVSFWQRPFDTPVATRKLPTAFSVPSGIAPPVIETREYPRPFAPAVTFTKTVLFPLVAAPVFTPEVEAITVDKWFRAFDQPVRTPRGLKTAHLQTWVCDPLTPAPIVSVWADAWHRSFDLPLRPRRLAALFGNWVQLDFAFLDIPEPEPEPDFNSVTIHRVNENAEIRATSRVPTEPDRGPTRRVPQTVERQPKS